MINKLHKRLTLIDDNRRAGKLEYKLSTREVRKIERKARKEVLKLEREEMYRKVGDSITKLFKLTYGPAIEAMSGSNVLLGRLSKGNKFMKERTMKVPFGLKM